ncbi:hypothetical protein HYC85_019326 [Camellia sinensis]|uniref:tRNA/rRNA methyltransferase SpoU type domain-containing protein n=1 Tax=Camellia sinensis TaxID=4442 RepID=A0A7J7GQH7_CAMSI|nr:hypothetical protein HYC85_019326 [Camellia sinensis]
MENQSGYESYVVVHNIAKRHNVGTLARSATAFGVSEVILVGRRDFNAFGSHGSTSHLRFRHFHSLSDARLFLKERDCDICGVEITDDAVAVNQHPFKKSTAFLLGNEGTGLSAKECEICDFFVYIPQYGCGTASLNVTIAASIVLHHFGVWAGFSERTRDGAKFVVAERPAKQVRRNYCAETADSVIEERKLRRENASNGFFDESGIDNSPSNLLDALFDEQHLCSKIRWLLWRRPRPKVVIRRFGKLNVKYSQPKEKPTTTSTTHLVGGGGALRTGRPIRIATFNVAMFSLAPAVPKAEKSVVYIHESETKSAVENQPKSILKQSPLHPLIKPKLKVSINLPDNEISLAQNKVVSFVGDDGDHTINRGHGPMRSPVCFPAGMFSYMNDEFARGSSRTILDVLREVDADILALQDVKAEEEKKMKPLSDLARALEMNYVFAESWAPEYGNAILSKWPIKRWRVQKIFDDQDFRNVLRATIDVPYMGEVNFHCTQLDHLNENWRMKQINAIIQSNDGPNILAGGLNSLDGSDYSSERWTDIVKYYEEVGKPTPKVEVMKFLNGKGYIDAKDSAGEYEPGTCKYGTRVDYVMASPDLPFKFVPGSYSVISSKGTSDHHIVKVEIAKTVESALEHSRRKHKVKQKFVRMTNSCSSRGIWRIGT